MTRNKLDKINSQGNQVNKHQINRTDLPQTSAIFRGLALVVSAAPSLGGIMCFALVLVAVKAPGNVEDDIADRIKKVGTVCVEGNACGAASPGSAAVSTVTGDVAANYRKTCATCHDAGVAGAPKLADADAWAPRISKGVDALYNSAIHGMPPAMPARGACFACSDDDLKALVNYMMSAAK